MGVPKASKGYTFNRDPLPHVASRGSFNRVIAERSPHPRLGRGLKGQRRRAGSAPSRGLHGQPAATWEERAMDRSTNCRTSCFASQAGNKVNEGNPNLHCNARQLSLGNHMGK